jgi:hypothetical protein
MAPTEVLRKLFQKGFVVDGLADEYFTKVVHVSDSIYRTGRPDCLSAFPKALAPAEHGENTRRIFVTETSCHP